MPLKRNVEPLSSLKPAPGRNRVTAQIPDNKKRGAISLSGITRIFAGVVPAADGIDPEIEAGELFTLRMIAGFEPPDKGRILISGREMQDVPAYKRAVNTLFQSYAHSANFQQYLDQRAAISGSRKLKAAPAFSGAATLRVK